MRRMSSSDAADNSDLCLLTFDGDVEGESDDDVVLAPGTARLSWLSVVIELTTQISDEDSASAKEVTEMLGATAEWLNTTGASSI